MNTKVIELKTCYSIPRAERIHLQQSLHLLLSVSLEAGFDDWEEGEEL